MYKLNLFYKVFIVAFFMTCCTSVNCFVPPVSPGDAFRPDFAFIVPPVGVGHIKADLMSCPPPVSTGDTTRVEIACDVPPVSVGD